MTYDPLWQTVAENPLPGMVRHTPPPVSTAAIGAVSISTPQNTVGAEGGEPGDGGIDGAGGVVGGDGCDGGGSDGGSARRKLTLLPADPEATLYVSPVQPGADHSAPVQPSPYESTMVRVQVPSGAVCASE